MKRQTLLKNAGFEHIETTTVLAALETFTTKTAKEVATRIKESDVYEIYTSEATFTVNGTHLITTAEQKQIEKVLKKKYVKAAKVMDDSGQWGEWIKAENGIIAKPAKKEGNSKYNQALQERNDRYRIMNRR